MSMITSLYEPGNQNLNEREASYRRENGFIGLALTIVFFLLLQILNTPVVFYSMLAIPLWYSALGFLQAHERFCVSYGLKGIQNTRQSHGAPEQVILTKARKYDVNKAHSLILRATIISVIATLLIMMLVAS